MKFVREILGIIFLVSVSFVGVMMLLGLIKQRKEHTRVHTYFEPPEGGEEEMAADSQAGESVPSGCKATAACS